MRVLRGVGLVLAIGVSGLIVFDLIKEPPRPDYAPVVRPTALDSRPPPVVDEEACSGGVQRWLVVGWDGAGWDQLLPLLDAGRLPHLEGLLDQGSHGNLLSFKPSLSPALWTTVATGRSPASHGIAGFTKHRHRILRRWDRISNLGTRTRRLMTNADRRVRALWNVLDEAGRNTLIVGYHNTFPAERLRGAMVSNWLVQAHMAEAIRADPRPESFALSLAHPPEIRQELVELERRVAGSWEREILDFVDFGPDPSEEFLRWVDDSATLGEEDRRWPYFVRRAWTFDRFHAEAALLLMPRADAELTMVHFQSVDWILHQFLFFHQPEMFVVEELNWDEATRARLELARPRYANTVTRFFEHLDTQLGRLIEAAGPGTSVMVLSDHGFDPHDDPWSSGHHDDAPPGFWVAAGPGVRRHVRLEHASLYDIAPTLAASLGHEVSRRLDGVVWDDILCEPAEPVAMVDDYERGPRYQPSIAAPSGLTDELERQLESLGYVR